MLNSFPNGCDRFKWIFVCAHRHSHYTNLLIHNTHVFRHPNQCNKCGYGGIVSNCFEVSFQCSTTITSNANLFNCEAKCLKCPPQSNGNVYFINVWAIGRYCRCKYGGSSIGRSMPISIFYIRIKFDRYISFHTQNFKCEIH